MRIIHKVGVIAAVTLSVTVLAMAQQSKACTVSATISPAKQSYIYQEPVRLNVVLSNSGPESVSTLLIFPYFNGDLIFKADTQKLVPREEYSNAIGWGGRSLPREIEPGGSWSFPIFLQTFYNSLSPGVYKLDYSMRITCVQGKGATTASSTGSFPLHIEPANPRELEGIVADYSQRLAAGESGAMEALLSMDTPLVIPGLKELIAGGNWERAFLTLARFKGDPDAEKTTLDSLHSKVPARQIAALGVLSKWNAEIPGPDVEALLKSSSRDVRLVALRYIQAVKGSQYLSLVALLLSDPDEYVIEEAKRTKEVLEQKR
jgi:hypothetical protein